MTYDVLPRDKHVCSKRTNYAARRREKRRMEALEKLMELCKPENGTGGAASTWKFVQK